MMIQSVWKNLTKLVTYENINIYINNVNVNN